MKALKYTMIDIRRIKLQIIIILIFGFFAYILSADSGDALTGILYLIFAATVIQGGVFNFEQKPETGFVNMLPGTDLNRIAGRFMTGVFLLMYSSVLAAIVAAILYIQGKADFVYVPEMII